MSKEQELELKKTGANGRAVPSHSTAVDSGSWDRTSQFKKMRSPATPSYFDDIFAFQLPNTKGTRKTHFSFIHHYVGTDGAAGPASARAMANSMAVLNGGRQGTVLRGAAREGVYRHIAAHYKDADREVPELKSDDDVDSVMMFKRLIHAPILESTDLRTKGLNDLDNIIDRERQVSWFDGEEEIKGVVIDAGDDCALVEEIDNDGEPTGELYELDYSEIKLRTFVVMEKADEALEEGVIVSWDTSKGKYYGDIAEVVTDGQARGEPQGLELEGSEDNPVYVIRVWMSSEMESEKAEDFDGADSEEYGWHVTNSTVVARRDNLTVEEALPTGAEDSDYHDEDDSEETDMKNIDKEFRVKLTELIKANSEILERLVEADVEEKTEVSIDTVAEEVKSEEVKSQEVTDQVAEIATEVVEEKIAEDAVIEEVVVEVVEEVKAEDVIVEVEPTTEIIEEKSAVEIKETAVISFDDLKEFHNLLKDLNK